MKDVVKAVVRLCPPRDAERHFQNCEVFWPMLALDRKCRCLWRFLLQGMLAEHQVGLRFAVTEALGQNDLMIAAKVTVCWDQ